MALVDNIVAYYKLDESSGNASDSVGSVTLTNNNTTTYSTGKINNGAVFNGSDQSLSATASLVADSWTISFWVKPDDSDISNQTMFAYRPSSGTANIIGIEGFSSMTVRCILFDSSSFAYKDYRTSLTLTQNAWNHFAITWNDSSISLYVNGSLDNSVTKAKDGSIAQTNTSRILRLGAETASSNFYDGSMDEVGIWSRALTSTEITELYNSGNGLQYPFTVSAGNIKKINGIAWANVKKINGIAVANIKKVNGITAQ
ncbi:MAG TPA: LamG domain-containing protein [Candidatus Cloacimonas acidaminovorans]|nr:LamG domain-containing protein [Candidatus Cloacimonas acidaminovorans]